ncbi:MAG: VWA domain-containing protein [Deltaproteobacteria bacterium]|nr:VWA domain-containing protein [Nannocystaceae bacterium]
MFRPVGSLALLLTACSYDTRDDAMAAGSSSSSAVESSGAPTGADTHGDEHDAPEVRLDVPGEHESSTANEDAECTSFTDSGSVTKRPADIIFVVDNSPSMIEETQAVQQQLNAFSQQIVDAGIDIRVLLLTAYPNPNAAPEIDTGVCIDPPLGGGGCPEDDDNQPIFAHVQQQIGSQHALAKILDTNAIWQPMMRPDSTKHIIVVSDDDSYVAAAEFDAQFLALDPSHAGYALDGIVATEPCGEGSVGEQYIALAELTGGVIGNLCEQEFQPLFDALSTAVLAGSSLSCTWPMPEAPEGKLIDPSSVEIVLTIDGVPITTGRVENAEACNPDQHGWYFDDPTAPTQIINCAQTCNDLEAAMTAELEIQVGCASSPAG